MGTSIILKAVFLTSLFALNTAHAQDLPPPAYQLAAQEAGIPSIVLYAVALQESGTMVNGKLRPWPWTLNVGGQGRFFSTREAACKDLTYALKNTSSKRIDVGLGQINVGYHGHRVNTPCELLNPYLNLKIASTILLEQHKSGQDWLITMGRYHSPANGTAAARYRSSVQRHYNRLLIHFTTAETHP
ncbi:hypothetical protein CUZ56_01368 [Saezia sanguinis]|uniref:Uncharacterized protein n=1 Tax=Saezia sanguinis TaxID=1965230 RepID=A0A433SFA0_9BURK|nr:transglycosylase SLT domain-containing protein [Saezia sanguinis]RUS67423.1 hypothetical protein CUZ56_01368 [Saezia sanguinis]